MPDTFTLTFSSEAEAAEHMAALGYRRLPIKGIIKRYAATLWDDFGGRYMSFACVAERFTDGAVAYQFAAERGRA